MFLETREYQLFLETREYLLFLETREYLLFLEYDCGVELGGLSAKGR